MFPSLEEELDCRLLAFICHQPIIHRVAYQLNKVIRRLREEPMRLAVLIDSGGGDIDAAAKIVKMLRNHCGEYVAIVPFWAKSAATLLAVASDEIIMCRSAELGPVDPQVRDPQTGIWVPASAIKEAIDFIEQASDPNVKIPMADKIPPFLMGAYRIAQHVSREYIEEALEKLGDKKEAAVSTFTDRYASHGYPIDRNQCKDLGCQ